MQLIRPLRSSAGDTIVEVLVAIAVISAVLGTAYAITNRSVQTNQSSQERSVALKVAESQFEMLKSWLASGQAVTDNTFCLYLNDSNQAAIQKISGSPFPVNCQRNPDGVQGDGEARYNVSLQRTASASVNSYTAVIEWDGPTGHDKLSMVYKVY